MRTQRFIVSTGATLLSAWAARPLASGARLSRTARRSGSTVGVGCPSFGGQRTGSSRSGGLAASVVTASKPKRPPMRTNTVFVAFNNQTARLAANAVVGSSRTQWGGVSGCWRGTVAALGQQARLPFPPGLTEAANTKQPVRQSRRAATGSSARRSVPWFASGRSAQVGAHPAPNHSVKGTSCGKPQAAPYLERWAP